MHSERPPYRYNTLMRGLLTTMGPRPAFTYKPMQEGCCTPFPTFPTTAKKSETRKHQTLGACFDVKCKSQC